jgi:hypothetical protein
MPPMNLKGRASSPLRADFCNDAFLQCKRRRARERRALYRTPRFKVAMHAQKSVELGHVPCSTVMASPPLPHFPFRERCRRLHKGVGRLSSFVLIRADVPSAAL